MTILNCTITHINGKKVKNPQGQVGQRFLIPIQSLVYLESNSVGKKVKNPQGQVGQRFLIKNSIYINSDNTLGIGNICEMKFSNITEIHTTETSEGAGYLVVIPKSINSLTLKEQTRISIPYSNIRYIRENENSQVEIVLKGNVSEIQITRDSMILTDEYTIDSIVESISNTQQNTGLEETAGKIIELGTITYQDINNAPADSDVQINFANSIPIDYYPVRIFLELIIPFEQTIPVFANIGVIAGTTSTTGITDQIKLLDLYSGVIFIRDSKLYSKENTPQTDALVLHFDAGSSEVNPQDYTAGELKVRVFCKKFPF